jgi:hypothetical protein
MNTPQLYAITDTGKAWVMKGLKPSERVMLLALRIAAYEKPKGVKRDELRAATGLPESSFDRAWTRMLKDELVRRLP